MKWEGVTSGKTPRILDILFERTGTSLERLSYRKGVDRIVRPVQRVSKRNETFEMLLFRASRPLAFLCKAAPVSDKFAIRNHPSS